MKYLTWSEGLNSRLTNRRKVNFGSNFECWQGFYYISTPFPYHVISCFIAAI